MESESAPNRVLIVCSAIRVSNKNNIPPSALLFSTRIYAKLCALFTRSYEINSHRKSARSTKHWLTYLLSVYIYYICFTIFSYGLFFLSNVVSSAVIPLSYFYIQNIWITTATAATVAYKRCVLHTHLITGTARSLSKRRQSANRHHYTLAAFTLRSVASARARARSHTSKTSALLLLLFFSYLKPISIRAFLLRL